MTQHMIPELENMLSAKKNAMETAQWLRKDYLPELVRRFNLSEARKRLGLYGGDKIPENERNLTDVRNRISLIVEYELARLSNHIIEDHELPDLFWSYVVANRFPDLEVRERDGTRHLRIEVKCLQSIAEEKSANFDTLKKDIHPGTDFVIVFLWEWAHDGMDFKWDRAPKLLEHFVFHAYSLAELRDHYWLNKPPSDLAGGYQGFDIRYAVNCSNGVFNEEEGNYGKLLRIWQENFPYQPKSSPILQDTETEYFRFKSEVVLAGFRSLCFLHLPKLSGQSTIMAILNDGKKEVGACAGEFGFFSKSLCNSNDIRVLMTKMKLKYAVVMTEKYACTGFEVCSKTLKQRFKINKPKLLSRTSFGLA